MFAFIHFLLVAEIIKCYLYNSECKVYIHVDILLVAELFSTDLEFVDNPVLLMFDSCFL